MPVALLKILVKLVRPVILMEKVVPLLLVAVAEGVE